MQLANECVQTNAAERVVLKRETPWREGSTYLAMSLLAFMQRLAVGRDMPEPDRPQMFKRCLGEWLLGGSQIGTVGVADGS